MKFKCVIPPVKPGDFGPCAFAVWNDAAVPLPGDVREVRDGDVVEAIGEIEISVEYEYTDEGREEIELAYRKVRMADGFEGTVCWTEVGSGGCGFVPMGGA